MPDYRVTWVIDIFDAASPRAAAKHALEIQRDPESTATVFTVERVEPDRPVRWKVDLMHVECTAC